MKRYENYKDSGVQWLGEIPEHWEILKLKFLFKDVSIKNRPELDLLSVTQDKGVIPRSIVENRMVMPSGNLESFKVISKGDFAISLRSFEGGLEYSEYEGIISPAYTVLKSQKNINDDYFKFLFKSKSFIAELQLSIVGIREGKNISYEELKYSYTSFPPLSEQTAIANFLDDKTVKIDQAIAIKEKEIALLKERRQILIQKAVTKGLDPNVKMKDSGVDWIGEIPEHWEVRKLKYIGNMFSGLTNKRGDDFSKEPNEGFLPFIPFTNIFRNNKISENEFQFVKSNSYDAQNVVEFNDILFLMSSETFDDIGKNSIYLGKTKVFLNSFCKGFKIFDKNINPLYINFLLLSKNYRDYFASVGRGFTRINIKQEYVLIMPILYIPLNEQNQIVSYLEQIEEKISKAISLKQQEIEKLKEYKTVIIDNVVTGKVRVS